jgi:hypothetical protein
VTLEPAVLADPIAPAVHEQFRPWEPLGMTTERWRALPATAVELASLRFAQGGVSITGLLGHARGELVPVGGDPLPHVVRWRGRLYLEDGHHRVLGWLLAGREHGEVRILDPEPRA